MCGGKKPALQSSDTADLAAAARRDADAMIANGRRFDPNNLPTYKNAAGRMTTMTNEQYDAWLRGLLDKKP